MKNFMKAIAFVTVMCMALSTVAFAAEPVELGDKEKVLKITVTDAENDQVALVIVDADAGLNDFSNPLYVDQTAAEDGTATFEAVLTNAEVNAVDVYVGYATLGTNGPAKLGDDIAITNPITEVVISNVNCKWELYHDDSEGSTMEQSATGAVLSFDLDKIPEGVASSQIAWEITYVVNPETGATRAKYSDAYDFTGISDVIESGSPVAVGLAFLNGSELNDLASVSITNIRAKIMFVGEALETGSQSVLLEDATPNQD